MTHPRGENFSPAPIRVDNLAEIMMVYQETFVERNQHRIYARDYPGKDHVRIVIEMMYVIYS